MHDINYHHIKINQFEGPLDMLLQLIEARELEITKISLAEVTDQYISYLKEIEETHPEMLVNFLTIASRLILIKSKALLPILEAGNEAEEDAGDLARRLEEYRVIKILAKKLQELDKQKNISFSRVSDKSIRPVFFPPRNATANVLHKYFNKISEELFISSQVLPKKEIKEIIKLEDRIKELQEKVAKGHINNFGSFSSKGSSRLEVIVNFLALLHLLRQGIVAVEQQEAFGEIDITKC